MKLSLIIPAYNALADVLLCLNTLHATASSSMTRRDEACLVRFPAQNIVDWLVQDDASPLHDFRALIPPTLAAVERNPINLGFGETVNVAAKRASGDVLVVCNQDIYATPEHSTAWDAHLLRAFDDPTVGIVAPRLLFSDGRVQSVGGIFDARCQPVHRCLGWSGLGHPDVSARREVSWVTGAMFAIRRDLFDQLGGFDPIFAPAYFEDADLSLRVRELGFKIMVEPAATLFHKVGSTGGSPHFRRSALRFKERWVNTGRIKPDSAAVMARYW